MHAVMVKVTINDRERAERELHENVVPMVSSIPGFVAGYWLSPEDGKGGSLVLFESEEQANAMVEGLKGQAASDGPVTFDEVRTRGVVASA